MIDKKDVLKIAKELNFVEPNEDQIKQIIAEHDSYANIDPTGNWYLWLEQQLYDMDLQKR